jgi:hypothetical protein
MAFGADTRIHALPDGEVVFIYPESVLLTTHRYLQDVTFLSILATFSVSECSSFAPAS